MQVRSIVQKIRYPLHCRESYDRPDPIWICATCIWFHSVHSESTNPPQVIPEPCKSRLRTGGNVSLPLPERRDDGNNGAGIKRILNFSCAPVRWLTLWLRAVMSRLTSSVSNSRLVLACEDSADVTRTKQKGRLSKQQRFSYFHFYQQFSVDMIRYFLWWKLQQTLHLSIHTCACVWHPVSVSRTDTWKSLYSILEIVLYNFCDTILMLNEVAKCYDQETSTTGLKSMTPKQLLFPFNLGLPAKGFAVTNRKIVQKTGDQITKELNYWNVTLR